MEGRDRLMGKPKFSIGDMVYQGGRIGRIVLIDRVECGVVYDIEFDLDDKRNENRFADWVRDRGRYLRKILDEESLHKEEASEASTAEGSETHVMRGISGWIEELGGRIDAAHEVMAPCKRTVWFNTLLLKAVRSTCSHGYEIVKGDQDSGTKKCQKCGDTYQYATMPFPTGTELENKDDSESICNIVRRQDAAKVIKDLERVIDMRCSVEPCELAAVADYLTAELARLIKREY